MKDILLNWKKISKVLGEEVSQNDHKGPTHEQIQRILDRADIQYRMITLILSSTGMRRTGLATMKLKDMSYLEDYGIYKFRVYPGTKHECVTFCTPECANAIKLYLEKYNPKGWLLLAQQGDGHIKPGSISSGMRRLCVSTGLGEYKPNDSRHRDTISSVHGLKHFCIKQMKMARVDSEYRRLMTDHSIGVGKSYMDMKNDELSDDDLLKEYIKAIPLLTIDQSVRTEAEVVNVEEKDKEISNLRQELYQNDEELRAQLSEKDTIMQKAVQGIDLLMKQREEDSKRIQELEGLIAKFLPMGEKISEIKEEVGKVRSRLKEVVKTNQ